MHRPTLPAVVPVPVPVFELWVGLAWWVAGAAALDAGVGTLVLAAALIAMVWLFRTVRHTHGAGAPLPRGGRAELLRRGGVTLGLVVALSTALMYFGYGVFTAPIAAVLVGLALVRTSRLLGSGAVAAAGAVLVGLGAAGAYVALNASGQSYGQAVVGLGAGLALWVAGGYRTRVLVARYGPR